MVSIIPAKRQHEYMYSIITVSMLAFGSEHQHGQHVDSSCLHIFVFLPISCSICVLLICPLPVFNHLIVVYCNDFKYQHVYVSIQLTPSNSCQHLGVLPYFLFCFIVKKSWFLNKVNFIDICNSAAVPGKNYVNKLWLYQTFFLKSRLIS